jgi:hypothetical protein
MQDDHADLFLLEQIVECLKMSRRFRVIPAAIRLRVRREQRMGFFLGTIRAAVDHDDGCILHGREIAWKSPDDDFGFHIFQIGRLVERLGERLQIKHVLVSSRSAVISRTRKKQDLLGISRKRRLNEARRH